MVLVCVALLHGSRANPCWSETGMVGFNLDLRTCSVMTLEVSLWKIIELFSSHTTNVPAVGSRPGGFSKTKVCPSMQLP